MLDGGKTGDNGTTARAPAVDEEAPTEIGPAAKAKGRP